MHALHGCTLARLARAERCDPAGRCTDAQLLLFLFAGRNVIESTVREQKNFCSFSFVERYSKSQVKTCIPIPALVARAVLPHAFTARERKNQTWWRATSAADRWSTVDGDGDVAETQSTLPRDNKKEGRARMGQLCVVRVALRSPEVRFGPVGRPGWRTPWAFRPFGFSFFFLPPGAAPT